MTRKEVPALLLTTTVALAGCGFGTSQTPVSSTIDQGAASSHSSEYTETNSTSACKELVGILERSLSKELKIYCAVEGPENCKRHTRERNIEVKKIKEECKNVLLPTDPTTLSIVSSNDGQHAEPSHVKVPPLDPAVEAYSVADHRLTVPTDLADFLAGVNALKDFPEMYPDSSHISKAQKRLHELEREGEEILESHKSEVCKRYVYVTDQTHRREKIEVCPPHLTSPDAKFRILYDAKHEQLLRSDKVAESEMWKVVKESSDPTELNEFLRMYPNSDHAATARKHLRQQAEKMWQLVSQRLTDPVDVDDFLAGIDALKYFPGSYPDSSYVPAARSRLRELESSAQKVSAGTKTVGPLEVYTVWKDGKKSLQTCRRKEKVEFIYMFCPSYMEFRILYHTKNY